MSDFSNMRLGKQAAFFHPFTPKFSHLMASAALPPPPMSVDYTKRIAFDGWPMFDNDTIGDCTVAAVGHLIELYTSYTKPKPIIMSNAEVIDVYSAVSGYNPDDPSTDNGAVEQTVLTYWMNHGVKIGSHTDRIAGFAKVNPMNPTELKYATWWFGGLYIGLAMPLSWQTATAWNMPSNLDGNNAPGSWGGHAVPVVAYNSNYLTVVTWGMLMHMDWEAYQTYCDESWAVINADFVNSQGVTPAHFDWPYLLAGMQHIREGIPVG